MPKAEQNKEPEEMRLPDFLIVGAARSGTTTLHELLRSHPGIYLPRKKRPEPHFFLRDEEYQKGIHYYALTYFSRVDRSQIAGESSTTYLYSRKACDRIRRHLPSVMILSILRNPVDRAFSHYKWNVLHGLETLPFSEALRAERDRLSRPRNGFEEESSPFSYTDRGLYFEQLFRYAAAFGRQRVHAVLLEDLMEDVEATAASITRFLGVSFPFDCSLARKKHNQNREREGCVSAEDRQWIVEHVREDVHRLEHWLDRDLTHWITS